MNPRYPIYIVSKGRWESRLTAKCLERMNVPYFIVVEAPEVDAYRSVIDSRLGTVLTLDPKFQTEYDTFDKLGDTKSRGPGPARNFAWEHSRSLGFAWHWVMDDNIRDFYRLNRNLKVLAGDGTIFRCMEDFCERYTNVVMAGPNYFTFIHRKSVHPPFIINTRIYSCNLIRNDIPVRWRGRYNEDTDLSLRILKLDLCTIQFNAFLQGKINTQQLKGGNTDAFYAKEGTFAKSDMLVRMHPDVAKMAWRFGRAHHHVDYSVFKNVVPIKKPGVAAGGVNDYGMVLKRSD